MPAPPHWATIRPPGRSAANRRSKSRSWSAIQWNVAVERIASTGALELELGEVGDAHVGARPEPLARLGDHRRRAVDGDHLAARQALEQRRRHAPGAAAGVEHALVAAQLEPVEHLAAHRLQRRRDALVGGGVPVARRHQPRDEPLGLVGRALDELAYLVRRPAPAAQHVPRDDVGVRRVGPPDPDADAHEVRAAELAPQRLQPVVAREPAALLEADVAERQVDLVVQHEHAVEVELEGAARGADGAPGVVHERLRLEHRDARAAGAGAALGQLGVELLLRLREVPAADQLVGDAEADVVRAVGVGRARVAEPDDQPVDRGGLEELQLSSSEADAASSPVAPSAWRLGLFELSALERLAVLADQLGLGLDLLFHRLLRRRGDRGDDGLVEVVEQRDALPGR